MTKTLNSKSRFERVSLICDVSYTHTGTVNMPTLRNLSTTSEGDINIIHTSAIFNHYVGTLLLNDRYGDRFDYETREKAKDIMEEVYEAWLTEDTNCSWVTLTDCFRQCGLHSLAYSIEQHFGLPSPLLVTKGMELCINKIYYCRCLGSWHCTISCVSIYSNKRGSWYKVHGPLHYCLCTCIYKT